MEPNAFIPRRRSGDNILIAHECVGKMLSNKSRQQWCAVKIVMSKAYVMADYVGIFFTTYGLLPVFA